jgi:hypothetical protein
MLSLLAGGPGGPGWQDGTGAAASFDEPYGVATDTAGNVYVAEFANQIIRKITPAGVVTTLAGMAKISGSTDGTGAAARFSGPWGVATDSAGNVYVADAFNNTIRKITPNGVVSTFAGAQMSGSTDGTGAAARFNQPQGVATDSAGNVYVADTGNFTIRQITPAGVVSTFAGTAGMLGSSDGTGAAARFRSVWGLATDSAGNVYVADTGNGTIRKITRAGVVSTFAGTAGTYGSADGMGAAAQFSNMGGVATDAAANVYVADTYNHTIRKITPAGVVTTLAGTAGMTGSSDGQGAAARFDEPIDVAADGAGDVYVADGSNNVVRKITPDGMVTALAGTAAVTGSTDGTGAASSFDNPTGLTTDSVGNVYVADTFNDIIRKITPAGVVTTLAGTAAISGSADGVGAAARFYVPSGVATDGAGDVYVADSGYMSFLGCGNCPVGNYTVRKITPSGLVTTFAGTAGMAGSADGTGAAARFSAARGVAADGAGNVYVADTENGTIRKITPAGVVTTLAGTAGMLGSTDGTGVAARFSAARGVATDAAGNVYVADTDNDTIRKITPAGVVTTLAGIAGMTGSTDGTGAAARFSSPQGVATDSAGNVYVADTGNDTIRKVTPAGVVTTIVGRPGEYGFVPGPLPGLLHAPQSVTLFGTTLYTTTNNAIVQVSNVP